jgi:glycyl-tRNA synthetase beta chain
MPDFLLEIGLEEVPARMLASAQAELLKRTLALLTREQLISPEPTAHSYSTPRRLAVLIRDVLAQQPDIIEDTTGPAVKIAFKDGVPTPAAEAFARKSGVAVSELKTISTPKGDYLAATTLKRGRTAAEVLAAELPKEIAAIYWTKNMYWRPGKPERFVRPVLWLACLLGEEVVPLTFAGKTAGRATYGHRVLSTGDAFEIQTPASYLAQLEGEYVLADVEIRRQKIRKALDKVTRAIHGARWREDEALVDAVTHLTEWPDVLLGNFGAEFLPPGLPDEVLVTVMRDHQKYFAVEDTFIAGLASDSHKLLPHFLTVTNIALDEINTPIIKQGNERVLRARFNDARFFWEFDQRTPLTDRVKLLENVTFQKDFIGSSYADKSKRTLVIARRLADIAISGGASLDATAVEKAATLAKVDLTTELVKEFTELQGIVGGLYASYEGYDTTVADAIYDQYLPASAKDSIPRSAEGSILGISDRIDTLSNMFQLGMEPTGSKDPFALRRAANAIVRILAESDLPISLKNVIELGTVSTTEYLNPTKKLEFFFSERIDFYLREARGQAYDVVKAAMAAGIDDLRDLVARAEAVTAMRGSEDFLAVSAAFKRMKNILTQARAKGDIPPSIVDHDLLLDPAEKLLAVTASAAASAIQELQAERNYSEALRVIAALRPSIDDFFDKVMVMSPEDDIRANRLALLNRTLEDLSRIADFSEIVTAG